MSYLHPHTLQYTIEHEIAVQIGISRGLGVTRFAIDRFAEDERRFRVGLIAIVNSDTTDQLYVGFNATANVGCLGYAPRTEAIKSLNMLPREKYWAEGSATEVDRAEFHFFYPDTPAVFINRFLMPFSRVCELATIFLESSNRPMGVVWIPNNEVFTQQ